MSGSSRRALDLTADVPGRNVQELRQLHDHVVEAAVRVGGPQLNDRAGDVRDEHDAVSVHDRATRRLDAIRADLVVPGRLEVLIAGDDLERPEPEEEEREEDDGDDAEDGDAGRRPRRQAVRLLDPRVAREEAPARGRPFRQRRLPLATRRRWEELAQDPVRGDRERQVESQRRQEHTPDDRSERGRVAEEDVNDQRADLDAYRQHRHRDEDARALVVVIRRRLAEAPGPVPPDGEQERREPERPEGHRVDEQAGPEAGDGTEERAAQERDPDEHEQEHVGPPLGQLERVHERDLDDRRERHEHGRFDGVERHRATRITTSESESKSTNGSTWIRM